ncbi:MAG: class I SAM-dependent methyltransferase [Patescibacteria group bacterium]|nr:class I SAM-dependent methyltransferase [Patescibacteria group bacterium]
MSNNYWDNIAKSFHAVSSRAVSHNKKYKNIARVIIKKKCSSVLDLGCGSGLLEKALFHLGYSGNITAVDSSSKMIAIAKSTNNENLDRILFVNKKVTSNLNINDNFDCVVMINLLYLIDEKRLLISKIRKILNEKGLLIIIDPKPIGKIGEMIGANFKGKNFIQIILYFFSEIKTIYHAFRFFIIQRKFDKESINNEIKYLELKELKEIINDNSFIIDKSGSIQANQNWFIISRRD